MSFLIWSADEQGSYLHYLIEKYSGPSSIHDIIQLIIKADEDLLYNTPDNLIGKDLMPDHDAIRIREQEVMNNYSVCITAINERLKQDPDNADLFSLLGYSFFREEDCINAIKYLVKAMEMTNCFPAFSHELIWVLDFYFATQHKIYLHRR